MWTYLGSEAARERFAAGAAVVAQDYFDAIRADFAAAGGLDAFERLHRSRSRCRCGG